MPVTLGEVAALLNQAGISVREARGRPRWEVEAVLGAAVAPQLARMREAADAKRRELPGAEDPDGRPPTWLGGLDEVTE